MLKKTGIRFCDQNRQPIFPDWFLIAIMIAIARFKIGIRLQNENR